MYLINNNNNTFSYNVADKYDIKLVVNYRIITLNYDYQCNEIKCVGTTQNT